MSHNEMNFKVKFKSYSSKYANNKYDSQEMPQ